MVWLGITIKEKFKKGLKDVLDDDLVLVGDLDEIPNLDELNFRRKK